MAIEEITDEEFDLNPSNEAPDPESDGTEEPKGLTTDQAFDEVISELMGGPEDAQEKPTDGKEQAGKKGKKAKGKEESPEGSEEDDFRAERFTEEEKTKDTSGDALPETWGEDKRKIWAGVSEEARKTIRDYEAGRRRITDKVVSEANAAKLHYDETVKPISRAMEEVLPIARKWAKGRNPVNLTDGIVRAVTIFDDLQQDLASPETAMGVIKEIMAKHQLSPENLVPTAGDQANGANKELLDRVDSLTNEISTLKEEKTQVTSNERQQYYGQLYDRFTGTRNAFGELKYPMANNSQFARAVGSRAKELMAEVPGLPIEDALPRAYVDLGGQIQTGSARSSNQDTTKLRNATVTAYNKGGSSPRGAAKLSTDDAYEAVFEELGLNPD
jgi:hypothetical protein